MRIRIEPDKVALGHPISIGGLSQTRMYDPDELFGGGAFARAILLAHHAIADVVLDDLGD